MLTELTRVVTENVQTIGQYVMLENLFRHAEQDHGNMRGRSTRYAVTFLGMINAYITTYFYDHIALDDERAHIACQQYMYGIFS